MQRMNTATKLLNAMRQNPNDWVLAKLLTGPLRPFISSVF